ncbi:carbohydrate kinase family protein [Kutzneria albida]|uniref:Carbohydrate kinase PfkB domain-containing protein n=1 Tax=Kutzneria albida DSM 43870 TaxID=1449976 RepID=W5WE67_9PSEU|nr:PfkB family carbohydrate kinase [Kutzneria albida]AHH99483.1 hypothetical protein KALB_6123 [Kutzneria albida DSM 43870]
MDWDVLVVGGTGVDTVVRVPSLPLPVADSIMVPRIERHVAHTGNGVARGCHALGLRTRLVDVIGADEEGALIRREYAELGLSFGYLEHGSGTRRSVNLVDERGSRVSLYDGRHPFDIAVDPGLYRPDLERAGHVHVSIVNWARHALAEAMRAGRTTSTDLHDWDGRNPYHEDFAFQADLVFLSTAALGDRTAATVRRILAEGRAQVVVAMAGAQGSHVHPRGARSWHVPAVELPDRPVVDTNGAGDSYVAGFLYRHLTGEPLGECARAGAIAGAYACGTAGTHTSFADRATLG